jgi:hypothetical protein
MLTLREMHAPSSLGSSLEAAIGTHSAGITRSVKYATRAVKDADLTR